MRSDSEGRQFRLEELEPRVLLSANLTALGTAAVVAHHHSPVVDEVSLPSTTARLSETHFAYDPAAAVQDMFAGVEQTPPAAPPAPAQSQSRAAVPTVDQSAPGARVQETPTTLATVNTAAPIGHAVSKILQVDSTNSQTTGASNSPSRVSELTRTLRSANGPPSGATAAQVSPNFAAIIGSSLKGCGVAPVVCGAPTSATATATSVPGSGSPSNPSHPTPLGLTPGLQDLGSYIADLLASQSASFTSTETLDNAALGNVLQLQGVTLGVTATLSAGGAWSGSVTISVAGATLFPGQSFTGKISSTTRDPALTGTYTIGGTFSLAIPQTASMVLQVGEALTITASGVSFSYDPNGAATQTLTTLQTATVTSAQFSGMPTATLSNFVIRGDGFSFDSFTLASAAGSGPGIGNFITTTGVTLTASDFNVSFGTDSTAASMSGTIGATITGLNLFPNGNLVQFQAASVSAAYSFAGFDGVSSSGQLQVTVSGLQLSMGQAFTLTASGDVVLTPGQTTMATVASATLSSPQFAGLGTVQVTNLALSQTGFTLGSLTWSSSGAVSIPGIINADSATVTVSNFSLQYGDTPVVQGSLTVSATNVVLFPSVPLLDLHLGDLAGAYQFGSPAILSLHIPNLDIPLGDALTIHLGAVDINPGETTMLHVASATVTTNLFSGLPSFSLTDFDLTQTGFSLGSFDLSMTTPVTIGSFLSFSNLDFQVSNFAVDVTASPVVSGSISLTLGNLTLFPGSSLVTSSFTNVAASYDFSSAATTPGQLTITAGTISLTIGGELTLSADNLSITPGAETLATIGSARLSFGLLNPDLAIAVNGLQIQQTGFSIESATATVSDNLTLGALGGLLALQAPTIITLTDLNYTFGGSLSGTVGFSTSSAVLNLGAALETSASELSGSYDLASGALTVTLDSFALDVAGLATFSASNAAITYTPAADGSATALAGITGVRAFMGADGAGVSLNSGTLALAVWEAADGTLTYALDATGAVSLQPAGTLSLSGNIEFRANTAGAVSQAVNVNGTDVYLNFAGNETSALASGLSLSVGSFVSVTGDFGFTQFTDATSGSVTLAIGATNVNATMSAGSVSVTVSGASLGLLLQPGAGGNATTYALVANGGTDTLTGVPGLSLSASGLAVRVRQGLDPSTVSGAPASVQTPGGVQAPLDFSNLGSGTGDVTDIEGTVTLKVANFVSLSGSFGFQEFTDGSGNADLAIGAANVTAVLGTSTANVTVTGANLGLLIEPGTGYALVATATSCSLNGASPLSLSTTGLEVRVRHGLDASTVTGAPTSVQTPGGVQVPLDFSNLGAGTGDVTDIEGSVTLNVGNMVSLSGSFGFQEFTDQTGGPVTLAIGAANVNAVLGTPTTNVSITGASLALLIEPGVGYALVAKGGTDALNGVPDLSVTSTGLSVLVRSGLDPSSLTHAPSSVQTPGGVQVPLDFSGLGSSDVTEIAGSLSINVANFVSLSGQFSFTASTTGTLTKILVGASDVTAFAGSVDSSGNPALGVQITGASFGLVIYRDSTATSSTYALEATAASIELVGLPSDVSLSSSAASAALSVAINTTGAAVNETIPNSPGVTFTDGTNGTPDQRNLKSFGGSLSLVIGPQSSPYFDLAGDFSITESVGPATTKVLIGAANVTTAAGATLQPDGSSDTFTLSNGTLGLALFESGGAYQGYALTASATASVAVGSALSGSATITIRRNTTTSAVDEPIAVGSSAVSVVFSDSEVASGGEAFQTIVLSNASLNLDNLLVITASQGSQSTPATGASSTNLTGVTLAIENGDSSNPQTLFSISAGSAVYTEFSGTVTATTATGASLPARADGQSWGNGDRDLVLSNITFSIGSLVTFSAASVDVQHYTTSTPATVDSFNFSGVSITFLAGGKPMVTLGGSAQFHYNSTDGFKFDSFTNPTFSFLDPTVSLGPITLVNPDVGLDNFQFGLDHNSPSGSMKVDLSATIHITVQTATIGSSTSPVQATITNLNGSFSVSAALDLLHPLAAPTIGFNGFTLQASQFSISLGSYLTLTATGTTQDPLMINPTATASQDLISFATLSASLSVGPVNLTGTASNFAIEGDGSFLAKPGFAVSITLGANDASSMSWPAWLPLTRASVTLSWANFNAHPDQFLIELSASVNCSIGPITLSGSVSNAVIDPQLLFQGKFPIISVDSISVSASGSLFGGSLKGNLLAGVVRFDANGALVDGLGNLLGPNGTTTTTAGTGPFTSVFYAGIEGSLNIGGNFGMTLRIGLSEYGPLQLYFEVDAGVDAPIPLGDSGVFIGSLRGGVTFGASFPTINITGSPSDALQLRQPAFSVPDSLTAAQWQAQLEAQVVNLYRSGAQPGDFSALFDSSVIIQAGVTLYVGNPDAFNVSADVLLDTSGKFLVIGSATIADSLSVGVKMYTDLSGLFDGSDPHLNILFLMEVPSQNTPNPITSPIYSLYGEVTFSYNTTTGVFQMSIAGEADFNLLGGLEANAEATLTLTFTANSFNLTLSNASFSIPTIQSTPLGTAAGTLTIQTLNGSTNIWGGFLLVPNLTGLQNAGIYAGGQVFIKLNTTSQTQQLTLQTTQGPYPLSLEPQALSLFVDGYADFRISGSEAFRLSGTLDLQITPDHLSMFVQAQLFLGGTVDAAGNLDNPLLTFNANGLIYVQWAAANGINPGFAAKITLTLGTGGNVTPGVVFGMNFLLVMNTTGSDVTYVIPAPLPTTPPSQPVPTVMGPDYSSSNPLALTSYETILNGQRALVVPNGPPANGLANYATWTPAIPNASYLIILGRGTVTLSNYLALTGAINITATLSGSAFDFSLEANATLAVMLNGSPILSLQAVGGLQLSNAGVAAALAISYTEGFTGFTLTGTFLLELNTTSQAVTLSGITVAAGTAEIQVTGDLKFLGGVVDLNGSFVLSLSGANLSLAVNANLTFFGATLTASGVATLYYDSSPGLAMTLQLGLPGGEGIAPIPALGSNFVITGNFALQINTCSAARSVGGATVPGNYFHVAVSNVGVYLFGFNLTGSLAITISSAGFSLDNISLSLNFFHIVTLSFSGYFHTDGSFYFSAYAGFNWGDGWAGLSANLSVSFSNSGFSASASGSISFLGLSIGFSGAVYISGGEVDLTVGFTIGWWIFKHTYHHTFHLGSTTSPPPVAHTLAPPAPSPPALAGVNANGVLVLYLGQDVGERANGNGAVTGAQAGEDYTLTRVTGDTGSASGETIQIVALGYTETFYNVTSVLVNNTRDSGGITTEDTIQVDNAIAVPVGMTLGTGANTSSLISTGSGPATINVSGDGHNQVTTGNNATLTVSGNGGDSLTTGSGSTITISGNGNNQVVTNGGSAPITLSGTGDNTVTIESAYSGTLTLASTASGDNVVEVSAGSPTVYVNGNGSNEVTVNGNSACTIYANGNGANYINALGSGAATVQVPGDGDNVIATGSGLATVYLTGSGDNEVDTGAGFATVYDQGSGANAVFGGPGGGLYIGGVNASGQAYATKGDSDLETLTGNFSAQISGYSSYALSDSGLTYGSFSLSLNDVTWVGLAAGSSTGANGFSLSGWSGSAALNGAGNNNTLNYTPASSVGSLNYVLANSSLEVSGGLSQTITLAGIQTANLYGASAGTNTYDVSGWTGGGSLAGPVGTTNTVIATDDAANFTLSNNSLARTGCGALSLTGIQNATLNGGSSANSFTANNWSGSATFDGEGGSDTYNLTLTGSGTGIFTVADSGPTPGDTLNITAGRNAFVTSSQVKVVTQRVNYSGIAVLDVIGSVGGLTYNVQSTGAGVTTAVQSSGSSNVFNVSSTAGVLPATAGVVNSIAGSLDLVGGGQDTLNVDDSASTAPKTGTLTPTALTGLGMGGNGISYGGLSALNIQLGSGGNSFNVQSIGEATTIALGSGANTVNVGTLAPAVTGGTLNGVQAPLTVTGGNGGADTLCLDDSADTSAATPTLTAASLTGVFGTGGSLSYSGIGNFNLYLGKGSDTMNVQGIDGTVNLTLGSGPNIINVGSTAGVLPVAPGVVDNIAGVLNVIGGGNDTLNVDDAGSSAPKVGTLTPSALTGLGMGASGTINYQGLTTLNIQLGSGGNTFNINGIDPATHTSVNGGASANNDVNATFAGAFDGRLDLAAFEHGTVAVAGNFNGAMTDTGPGQLESVQIGQSLTAAGSLTADGIDDMTVGGDLAGTVTVSGALSTLTVGGDVSGSVIESGTVNLLTIGGSLTGAITAANTQDSPQVPFSGQVTLANINTMTVGHDLAGTVTVTGNLGTPPDDQGGLTVGTTAADSLSGAVAVGNTLTNLTVTGDLSGKVTESGSINLLTIGGSLTAEGIITAANTAYPPQVPWWALANLNTFNIAGDLAGKVTVTGNLITLTVGGNLSGRLSVQNTLTTNNNALTTMNVTGDVSGTVAETGTVNLLRIGGSLTATGVITAFNAGDPTQVPSTDPMTLGNINTFTIGRDLAGNVIVSGNLVGLTVGDNLSGTVSVLNTLTTMYVTGDVSGAVAESGTINSLTLGGSLALGATITASNLPHDPSELPQAGGTTLANITTMFVGDNLAGTLLVTGNVATLSVGSRANGAVLSGGVTVNGTLTSLSVMGDVSGSVTESGTVDLLTIDGSLTGTITAANTQDSPQVPVSGQVTLANINTLTVGGNLSGTVTVTGNLGTVFNNQGGLTVGADGAGSLSGTVAVGNTLTNLMVTGDVSGSVFETGTINLLAIGGSLTAGGVIAAFDTADPTQAPSLDPATLGNINTFTIGRDLAGKVTVTGNLITLTVGGNLSGTVTVQNTLTTMAVAGDLSGTAIETGAINLLTIGGSLTQTGLIKTVNTVPAVGNMVTMSVGQDFAGTLIVSGTLGNLAIVKGSMTPKASITAAAIGAMTVGPGCRNVRQNLAGQITVLGTFQSLRVAGGAPGSIIVGHMGTVSCYGGPVVLQITENGVPRRVQATPPLQPDPLSPPTVLC